MKLLKINKNRINFTGQKIGTFTFFEPIRQNKNNYRVYYRAICDCGSERILDPHYVKKRNREFCRCKDNKSTEDICADQLYLRYKLGSTKRKNKELEFDLNKIDFKKLVLSKCTYCNNFPKEQIITVNKKHKLAYNGLDRVNNSLGYTIENVVACCWICNQAKRDRSFEEFKNWIIKVYNIIGDKT